MSSRTPSNRRPWSARGLSRSEARHNQCAFGPSVPPDQTRQLALNLYVPRIVALRLILPVRRVEADHRALAAEGLERRFLIVDQRHHDLAVTCRIDLPDEREAAVEDAFLDHRIAGNFEGIMLAGPEQRRGNREVLRALKCLDGRAGRDAP